MNLCPLNLKIEVSVPNQLCKDICPIIIVVNHQVCGIAVLV